MTLPSGHGGDVAGMRVGVARTRLGIARMRVVVRGAVQGVGFRPFVYRLAHRLQLAGWVKNTGAGVVIEAEGPTEALARFPAALQVEKPPLAFIQGLEHSYLDPAGYAGFVILESESAAAPTALVLPDVAACPDCLREVLDPSNRRHLYPFTNCTNCGPRYTIIEGLPYDRAATSMAGFRMCPECLREYNDPADRRFHAQPNACPACGPQLELWSPTGEVLARRHEALLDAAAAIRRGAVVAVKGIGGFHLMADARSGPAVRLLRARKRREEKPFAIMVPSLDAARGVCAVGELEERLLTSPEAPIVLLERLPASHDGARTAVAAEVAPGNPSLGAMLPYTPLHHLLLSELGFPVVATSGNVADEPICIDEREALARLEGMADLFLVHDRPILRHVDDSIVRIVAGRELVLRRARGFAPLPVPLPVRADRGSVLAVGAHLKNTVALSVGGDIVASQHIGDLETAEAHAAFEAAVRDLTRLFAVTPSLIVHDMHPDYLSTRHARESGVETLGVQHHFAHVAACMADNGLDGEVLGVSWDGTGFGLDGTVWGGEFLLADPREFERLAAFRTFMLPGGDAAVKQPRRTALGVLFEIFGEALFEKSDLALLRAFPPAELRVLRTMLAGGVNAPRTSSAGRLFDAVAALLGLRGETRFEGQAAMELEFVLAGWRTEAAYDLRLAAHEGAVQWNGPPARSGGPAAGTGEDLPAGRQAPVPLQGSNAAVQWNGPPARSGSPRLIVDWRPAILGILADLGHGEPPGLISAKFHNTLVEAILLVAREAGSLPVVLSGGCFQNRYLTERAVRRLREEGFRPYWHQRVPPNDGGIAVGQVAVAAARRNASVMNPAAAS